MFSASLSISSPIFPLILVSKFHRIRNSRLISSTCKRTFHSSIFSMSNNPSINPAVQRLQEIVNTDPINGWDKSWSLGIFPWDLGKVTPAVSFLVQSQNLPDGKILVPGCGSGYDVLAMASPSRFVIGLDLSENAILRARELSKGNPSQKFTKFVLANFFDYFPKPANDDGDDDAFKKEDEKFDAIFDYTFFCAIEPARREEWAKKMNHLLRPGGILFTLIFPISNHEGGPPYAVSFEILKNVLSPYGFVPSPFAAVESVPAREGKEMLVKWQVPLESKI